MRVCVQRIVGKLGRARLAAVALLALLVGTPVAVAELVITEIQSNQNFSDGEDWWELTNFGAAPVDLNGWKYDDNSADATLGFTFGELTIGAGESLVFVEGLTSEAFHDWWGTSTDSYRVVTYSGSGLGLGQNDAVNLFDASDNLVLTLSYAAEQFVKSDGTDATGGHAGLSAGGSEVFQSLIIDPNFPLDDPRYTFAEEGKFLAFTAANGLDVGSPGITAVPEAGSLAALAGLVAVGIAVRLRKSRRA